MLTPLSPMTTGNFLLNNYKQAIQIIKDYSLGVCTWKQCLGISHQDIDGWLEDKEIPEEFGGGTQRTCPGLCVC